MITPQEARKKASNLNLVQDLIGMIDLAIQASPWKTIHFFDIPADVPMEILEMVATDCHKAGWVVEIKVNKQFDGRTLLLKTPQDQQEKP